MKIIILKCVNCKCCDDVLFNEKYSKYLCATCEDQLDDYEGFNSE